jgi:hypothetical protein
MIPSAIRTSSHRVGVRVSWSLDEVEVVRDHGEVGAREVDLAQGEGVLVWHELVLPEVVARPSRVRLGQMRSTRVAEA